MAEGRVMRVWVGVGPQEDTESKAWGVIVCGDPDAECERIRRFLAENPDTLSVEVHTSSQFPQNTRVLRFETPPKYVWVQPATEILHVTGTLVDAGGRYIMQADAPGD